jgi:hypothetical protein
VRISVKRLSFALVAALVIAAPVLVPSPAHAAGAYGKKDGVNLYFNASPEPVRKCRTVTLAAEIYDPSISDHSGFNVSFLFRRAGTPRYIEKKMKGAAYNGRATAFAKQCYPGRWKAIVWAGDWTGPSVTDYVKVR